MSGAAETHCRLCAEPKTVNQAISIYDETGRSSDLRGKLQFFCVDVSPLNKLPKTVCLGCFDFLTRTWSFFNQVRESQKKLNEIYIEQSPVVKKIKMGSSGESSDSEASEHETLAEGDRTFSVKIEDGNEESESDSSDGESMDMEGTENVLEPEVVVKVQRPKFKRNRKKAPKSEVTCTLCNKEFRYPYLLKHHNRSKHSDEEKPFQCDYCQGRFLTRMNLRSHIKTHSSERPFRCEICDQRFLNEKYLKKHIGVHSGEKPFVCEECGRNFRMKDQLKSHSIIHTDNKPFECNYCNLKFRFKQLLNVHIRQHTGEKPYSCTLCNRDFTNGSNYRKHMLRRHNLDPSLKKTTSVM